jgi:hypothetical protein
MSGLLISPISGTTGTDQEVFNPAWETDQFC